MFSRSVSSSKIVRGFRGNSSIFATTFQCNYTNNNRKEQVSAKQIVKMAAEDEQEFVRRLTCQSAKEQAVKTRVLKKELELKERRVKELDGIIKRLYEDNITGKLSDERFKIFSADYEQEQHSLREEVVALQKQFDDAENTCTNISSFLKMAKRYADFDELTPAMLRDLIEKIIVHEGDKSSGHREQRIEIYYTFIGAAESS